MLLTRRSAILFWFQMPLASVRHRAVSCTCGHPFTGGSCSVFVLVCNVETRLSLLCVARSQSEVILDSFQATRRFQMDSFSSSFAAALSMKLVIQYAMLLALTASAACPLLCPTVKYPNSYFQYKRVLHASACPVQFHHVTDQQTHHTFTVEALL